MNPELIEFLRLLGVVNLMKSARFLSFIKNQGTERNQKFCIACCEDRDRGNIAVKKKGKEWGNITFIKEVEMKRIKQ